MRIIAGEFRGRRLLAPEGDVTRPITDRVKQSLFDILAPTLPGARVYDCFAGTGSMGLECLSRGAAAVSFFEADRSAAARLRRNIETLTVADRSTVIAEDLFRWFRNVRLIHVATKANLIFLDPPYRFVRERSADLQQLVEQMSADHLAPDGILIFRHDAADTLELPSLQVFDSRKYGSMTLEFCRAASLRDNTTA